MRWRLVLEEYGPELRHVPGERNIMADALSRLEIAAAPASMNEQMFPTEMAELFEAEEEDYPTKFPLSYQEIADRQYEDPEIRLLLREKPEVYKKKKKTLKWIAEPGN
jgi:hypothetical protein